MLYPARYFVRFLWLSLVEPSLEEMNKVLGRFGLAAMVEDQYTAILDEIPATPDNFQPVNPRHRSTASWLKKVGIRSLVREDGVVQEMKVRILGHAPTREKVEHLLIGNVSPHEISYRLQKLRTRVTDGAVAEFRHYFWDTRAMGVADWAAYFSQDRSGRTHVLQDPYMAALQAGPSLALYRVGVETSLNTKTIMEGVMRELWHTFQETCSLPLSQRKVEMLGTLSRNIARADERLKASDTALQDILKQFEKFKVLTDSEIVPSLADLAPTGTVSDRSREEIVSVTR